jgi:hypothetical protein
MTMEAVAAEVTMTTRISDEGQEEDNNSNSNSGSNIITPVGGVKRKPAVCTVWIVLLFAVIKISKG